MRKLKKDKFVLISVIVIGILSVLFTACGGGNDPFENGNNNGTENEWQNNNYDEPENEWQNNDEMQVDSNKYVLANPQSLYDIEKNIGEVNQVFTNSARFFTGQVIDNFCGFGTVTFYGELVEYNSISAKITSYVENLESNNALMHQNYPGMKYDDSKKYVELSTYTSNKTNEIVVVELRIFYGNFMETYNKDLWYAKSVMFSPDLVVDMQAGKNIETGECANYWGNEENSESSSSEVYRSYTTKTTTSYPDVLNGLGSLNKVYANFYDDGTIETVTYSDKSRKFVSYYAEYNQLAFNFKMTVENLELNGMTQNGYNVTEEKNKYYVEYVEYTALKDSEEDSVGIRIVDVKTKESMNKNGKWSWYAKCMDIYSSRIKDGFTIFNVIMDYENSSKYYEERNYNDSNSDNFNNEEYEKNQREWLYKNIEEVTEYPDFFSDFGEISKVLENSSSKYTNDEWIVNEYLVEYNSLEEKFTKFINLLAYSDSYTSWKYYEAEADKYYVNFRVEENVNNRGNNATLSYLDFSKKTTTSESDIKKSYFFRTAQLSETYSAIDYIYENYESSIITTKYPSELEKIGKIKKVYTNVDMEGNPKKNTFFNGSEYYISYYAEYSKLNDDFQKLLEKQLFDGCGQRGYGVTEDLSCMYIEYIETYEIDTDELERCGIRIVDPVKKESFANSEDRSGGYAYCITANKSILETFTDSYTLYDYVFEKLEDVGDISIKVNFANTNPIDLDLTSNKTGNYVEFRAKNISDASYSWYVNGNKLPYERFNTVKIYISDYEPGMYQVLLVVKVDSEIYSAQADLEIME